MRDLLRVAAFVFSGPNIHLAGKKIMAPGDLHGERLISLAPEDTARKQLDHLLAVAGAKPQIVIETQFSAAVCELAAAGAGIGMANALSYVCGGYERLVLWLFRCRPPSIFVLSSRFHRNALARRLSTTLSTFYAWSATRFWKFVNAGFASSALPD